MGEIKSTLDLVMARTAHLKLSEADKQKQSRRQLQAKLNGLLQKVFDQALRLEELDRALADLGDAFDLDVRAPLTSALLKVIDVGKDNDMALALLKNHVGVDIGGLKRLLLQYQEALEAMRADHASRLKKRLSDKYSIAGSAVFPNLGRDDQWIDALAVLKDQYSARLMSEKENLRRIAAP
jgi:hypothetical protein